MPFELPADLSWPSLVLIAGAVTLAYLVFGATGFGSSIVSVPVLAHVLPLAFVVPLITAVDLGAVATAAMRQWRDAVWRELGRLLLPAALGIALGSTVLVRLPRELALVSLGVFVIAYAAYTLAGTRAWRAVRTRWAVPAGIAGGVFSALFGTGGPIYMAYLASRIEESKQLRATSSLMVGIAVVMRAVAFALTPLWLQPGMPGLVVLLVPCMLAGYALGSRLHIRLAGAALRKAIAWVLLANGVLLIARAA
jgi:uncharacterized membrane protein YfcA